MVDSGGAAVYAEPFDRGTASVYSTEEIIGYIYEDRTGYCDDFDVVCDCGGDEGA